MKVKCAYWMNGQEQAIHEFPEDAIAIMNDKGDVLYEIRIQNGSMITVRSGGSNVIDGKEYSDSLIIKPVAENVIRVERKEYTRKDNNP
jgi:hypothetical protein